MNQPTDQIKISYKKIQNVQSWGGPRTGLIIPV